MPYVPGEASSGAAPALNPPAHSFAGCLIEEQHGAG